MIRPPREQREKTQADEEVDAVEIEEPARMWAKSVVDIEGEILCGTLPPPLFFSRIVHFFVQLIVFGTLDDDRGVQDENL